MNKEESRVTYSLSYQLGLLSEKLREELKEKLARYELDLKLWHLLMQLWEEDKVTQIQLSKRCNIPSYTMTRLLDQLQQRQLIERRVDENNRRAFFICLTPEAKALEQDVLQESERIESDLLGALSHDEQQQLLFLIRKAQCAD